MKPRLLSWAIALSSLAGCAQHHQAELRNAAFPPPVEAPVLHSNRLWIELSPETADDQCVEPELERALCFEEVRSALGSSLAQALWTSFPRVDVRGYGDEAAPGDYVLLIDVRVEALPPDPNGPGWSARANGKWQLVRDGVALAGEEVSARSRQEFGYGRPLGVGAGEAVDAIAAHVASVLAKLPESRPLRPVPLPQVVARPLPAAPAKPATQEPAAPVEAPAADSAAPPAASPGQSASL